MLSAVYAPTVLLSSSVACADLAVSSNECPSSPRTFLDAWSNATAALVYSRSHADAGLQLRPRVVEGMIVTNGKHTEVATLQITDVKVVCAGPAELHARTAVCVVL